MFGTIVLALDGSDRSDTAIPVASELARLSGASIVIAHAQTRSIEPAIDEHLGRAAANLRDAGLSATRETQVSVVGDEADVIAEVARRHNAGLVVMASRGRGPWAGAILGGTAQRTLAIAPCPVLVVPAHAQPDPGAAHEPAAASDATAS